MLHRSLRTIHAQTSRHQHTRAVARAGQTLRRDIGRTRFAGLRRRNIRRLNRRKARAFFFGIAAEAVAFAQGVAQIGKQRIVGNAAQIGSLNQSRIFLSARASANNKRLFMLHEICRHSRFDTNLVNGVDNESQKAV